MARLVVGPFNRVEGDLEVSLDVDAGQVREARVTAPLYRGFENLLIGRPLLDALVIVPRICGICSVSQSAAAVAALESLAAAAGQPAMPRNGRLASNLILASEVLLDHLTHFYLFFMPDFAREEYAAKPWYPEIRARFQAQKGRAAGDFLPVRARFLTVLGILAGKWPHTLVLRPGGVTKAVAAGEKVRLLALLTEMRRFLERQFFGAPIEAVLELADAAALGAWAAGRQADWPRFLTLAEDLGLDRVGQANTGWLAAAAYPAADLALPSASPGSAPGPGSLYPGSIYPGSLDPGSPSSGALFPGGVLDRTSPTAAKGSPAGKTVRSARRVAPPADRVPAPVDPARIDEDTHAAWYDEAVAAPADGRTQPQATKDGAYTWCKAPRYGGRVVETGAFARQRIAGQPLIAALAAGEDASVRSRVVARGIEIARLLLAMEAWVGEFDEKAPFHVEVALPPDGVGVGLIEAARGTLGHWLRVEGGRIASYQIIAPTTWNFSPRDAAGVPGPLEQALVGLPMRPDGKASALVQHVVRSFDPCLACTVH